jgi:hypothetical protein
MANKARSYGIDEMKADLVAAWSTSGDRAVKNRQSRLPPTIVPKASGRMDRPG